MKKLMLLLSALLLVSPVWAGPELDPSIQDSLVETIKVDDYSKDAESERIEYQGGNVVVFVEKGANDNGNNLTGTNKLSWFSPNLDVDYGKGGYYGYIGKFVYYAFFIFGVLFFGMKLGFSTFHYFKETDNPQLQIQYKNDMKEPLIGMVLFTVGITLIRTIASFFF